MDIPILSITMTDAPMPALKLGMIGRKHLTFVVFCLRRNRVYSIIIDIRDLRRKSSPWKSELMTRMTHSQ